MGTPAQGPWQKRRREKRRSPPPLTSKSEYNITSDNPVTAGTVQNTQRTYQRSIPLLRRAAQAEPMKLKERNAPARKAGPPEEKWE